MTRIHNKNPRGGHAGALLRVRSWGRFQLVEHYTAARSELKGPPSTNTSHGVLVVVAPDEAIIGLQHERGSNFWHVNTRAGTLTCSTRGLIRFKRFQNRCAYRLGLAFSSRPTQAEWLEILNHALRNLLEEPGPAEGRR
jgi:hypothetical protein